MKRLLPLLIVVALPLSACGGGSDSKTDAAVGTKTTPTGGMVIKWVAVNPPDETAYLQGLERREPERSAKISQAQKLELGRLACDALVNSTSTQAHVQVTSTIETKLVSFGLDAETAQKLAPDIKNAASEDAFCRLS